MIKVKNIAVLIKEKNILKNISFETKVGEIFNILGHNGCGKTSLLKSIIGLNKIKGEILFKNKRLNNLSISERSNLGISYIMQEIPEYTGISVDTYLKGILKNNFNLEQVSQFFTRFGLNYEVYKTRFFDSHLSGGERKKIEIITNFLMNKDLYLLDEIETSLDATSRDILIKLILDLQNKGKTFIIVSHSKDILKLATNGILLCNGVVDVAGENSKLLKKYFGSCKSCNKGETY